MSVKRDSKGRWTVRIHYKKPNGKTQRIEKTSAKWTRRHAEKWERDTRQALADVTFEQPEEEEVSPTFDEWFNGRYWREWVVANKNKPGTTEAKRSVYEHHLKSVFGNLRIDQIGPGEIAEFRAKMVDRGGNDKPLSDKTINNILAVLSKPLKYAEDVEIIAKAPKVGLLKIERPDIEWWELAEYARILRAARAEGPLAFAAVCLAGEAGLRVGEVKALRWREDVDLEAGTITVNQQMRRGVVGTPKGRTRRKVPMTARLAEALRELPVVREGLVIEKLPGHAKTTENQLKNLMYRICRRARLPERGWHCLRHTYGTHAALFGVNPWSLMAWMGHKRIDETMRYVHVAKDHHRAVPGPVISAPGAEHDPDRRVLMMLSARMDIAQERQHGHSTDPGLKAVR